MADKIPTKRCAIYVRKSSEEGLDMSYNSLEAQTDACADYISSQRHEGWARLPKVYADGGYSGGNMERPGLKELMFDVEASKIDIIVVYKIDRLTRSLTDFAKLNDVLDRHEVSFVAVTQQFNTSTSMGRLTLNVLLSFAQFEREVAGERIRDKVAASKKKGMWMGGPVPLGYAVEDRKLIIIPAEAKIVQSMLSRYLELQSVHLLQCELEKRGVRTRTRTMKDGRTLGGCILGRGAISHMLKNPIYLGKIKYQDNLHDGQHDAIVEQNVFDAVQLLLNQHSPGEPARAKRHTGALLQGLLFDTNGERLLPTYAMKKGTRYYYYSSSRRMRSATDNPDGLRVPAGDLERLIMNAVADRLRDHELIPKWASHIATDSLAFVLRQCSDLANNISSEDSTFAAKHIELIQKVILSKTAIEVRMDGLKLLEHLGIETLVKIRDADFLTQEQPTAPLIIEIKSHLLRCGKQVKLIVGNSTDEPRKINEELLQMVVRTKRWFDGLNSGKYQTLVAIAKEERLHKSYVSRLLSVAFLAPDIVERILVGDHAATLTPERLRKACPLPMSWDDQRAILLG